MGRYLSAVGGFASGLLEYETQKVVQIHSKKVGLTFRLIQFGIILYVVLWVMLYEKGYQSFDQAVSGVTAKLKGIAFANVTDNPAIGASVWDAADYVIPPQQNSAFFVMTNLISTPGQTLGRCEESHDVYGNSCKNDSECHSGKLVMIGSGVQTGRCVSSTRAENLKVCEIYGWCPTEYDITPHPNLLTSAENFTVMLKNSIEFPRYRIKRRNILPWMDKLFLKTCRYNPHDERMKFCPIFRLGDILDYSDALNKNIWIKGGMVSIHIEWNCNLDFDEEHCVPKYVFRRLDDFKSPVADGWNFRFSQHYFENGVRKRNLIKAYGIQFFITVYGTGGKFNVLTFSMNLGSGLALLGIATVLCDMIVLNTTRKRGLYRKAKVDLVAQKEAKERLSKRLLEGKNEEKFENAVKEVGFHADEHLVTKDRELPIDTKRPIEREKYKPYKPCSENDNQSVTNLRQTMIRPNIMENNLNQVQNYQPSLIGIKMVSSDKLYFRRPEWDEERSPVNHTEDITPTRGKYAPRTISTTPGPSTIQ